MKPVLEFLASLSDEERRAFILLVKEASGCYDEAGKRTEPPQSIAVQEVERLLIPVIESAELLDTPRFRVSMERLNYTKEDILSTLAGYAQQMGLALSAGR